ncbi:NACHT domain-containing protein [Streptomyces sp. 846.5]|nr:NACHT domain-containing protein [Streptomyces sp. 846.5]
MTGLNQRALYDAVNAERMLPLRLVRMLAEGLDQDPQEAERLWAEAKQERDRTEEAQRRGTYPAPTSWADIPIPSPALRDLLEAQDVVLDCLPYTRLGLAEPRLSAVYVRQSMRFRPAASSDRPDQEVQPLEPGASVGAHHAPGNDNAPAAAAPPFKDAVSEAPSAEPSVGLPEALARHEHLLVTGEAGAGKSTMANQLVRTLGGVWLRRLTYQDAAIAEPVVPLRVSATLLVAEAGSWSEVLRSAVLRTLRHGLVTDPSASLFGRRPQGARWLVFVDGLDEVADPRQRADLIRTLARHARPGSDFRLVITSRPLPPAELAPLHDSGLGGYEVQPFGQPELREYAHRWFEQQRARVAQPEAAAKRFLREVAEGQLRELVRNPLLATITLVHATLEPLLPLPSSRLALYGSFLDLLRDRTPQGKDSPYPAWLADSLEQLVRTLARLRTEGREDLLTAARSWVDDLSRQRRALPTGWETELPAALARTGLLVVAGDQLRFLHHSFAEYLAAQDYADSLVADSAALEPWIRRASNESQRSLAMFVLCRRAAAADGSVHRIFDQVFSCPGPPRVLLAAALATEGVDVDAEYVAELVRRLTSLVRGDDVDESRKAARALSALNARYATAQVLERLAGVNGLSATQHFYIVEALSRLVPAEQIERLLTPLLERLYGLLPNAAQLAQELGETSRRAIRQRVADLLDEPDVDAWERTLAAETYRALGSANEARWAARQVLSDPLAGANLLSRAANAWFESAESTAPAADVFALGQSRPADDHAGRLSIALALERAGATDEAADLAHLVLECDRAVREHREAAELWLKIRGSAAAEPVLALIERGRSQGWETWRLANLLKLLVEAGVPHPATEWARNELSGSRQLPINVTTLIDLLTAAEGSSSVTQLKALIGDGIRLHPYDISEVAQALLDGGRPEDAFQIAELALGSPTLRAVDFMEATQVVLKSDRERATEILSALVEQQQVTGAWGAGVLDALAEDGMPDLDGLSVQIADHVLTCPSAEGVHVQTALGILVMCGGQDALPRVARLICEHPILNLNQARDMAQTLAACGEEETALVIWRHLLSIRGRASDGSGIQILEDIAQALGHTAAADLIQEQLNARQELPPFHRRRLGRLLSWLDSSPAYG